jgi:hypothetical protein
VRVAYSAPEKHEPVAKVGTHAADLVWNEPTLYRQCCVGYPKRKHELICLFGASRIVPNKLPNGQKSPNGQQKYSTKKRVSITENNVFLVL